MTPNPPHILIVDDQREIRDALVRYLEKNGMRATSAANTAGMDAAVKIGQFDLIVLDVMMPGEDRSSFLAQATMVVFKSFPALIRRLRKALNAGSHWLALFSGDIKVSPDLGAAAPYLTFAARQAGITGVWRKANQAGELSVVQLALFGQACHQCGGHDRADPFHRDEALDFGGPGFVACDKVCDPGVGNSTTRL